MSGLLETSITRFLRSARRALTFSTSPLK
jgi:hypothetical protein